MRFVKLQVGLLWILLGSFPPRRTSQAGLIFVQKSGVEAGGLVYAGEKRDGVVSAGGILTFDKYGDDQIVALQYSERGGRRTQGSRSRIDRTP